jgi:hypothetical protein
MTKRSRRLVGFLFLILAGLVVALVWPTGQTASTAVAEPRASTVEPVVSVAPRALAPVPAPVPAPQRVAIAPAPSVALVNDRDAWAGIPLDRDGTSLGVDSHGQNKTTPFNRAFSALIREDVIDCLQDAPHEEPPMDGGHSALMVSVALALQGNGSGYDVFDAELLDGDIDVDRKRCLELALTRQVQLPPDQGGEAGKRYRIEFPLMKGFER